VRRSDGTVGATRAPISTGTGDMFIAYGAAIQVDDESPR
jgi:hypothetical protein